MKNKTLLLTLLFLAPATLMAQQHAASGQAPHAAATSLTSIEDYTEDVATLVRTAKRRY